MVLMIETTIRRSIGRTNYELACVGLTRRPQCVGRASAARLPQCVCRNASAAMRRPRVGRNAADSVPTFNRLERAYRNPANRRLFPKKTEHFGALNAVTQIRQLAIVFLISTLQPQFVSH